LYTLLADLKTHISITQTFDNYSSALILMFLSVHRVMLSSLYIYKYK